MANGTGEGANELQVITMDPRRQPADVSRIDASFILELRALYQRLDFYAQHFADDSVGTELVDRIRSLERRAKGDVLPAVEALGVVLLTTTPDPDETPLAA